MPKFSFSGDFELEVGETLTGFDLSYQTFGKLNADKGGAVVVLRGCEQFITERVKLSRERG